MRVRQRDRIPPVGAPREGPLVDLVREHLDSLEENLGRIANELSKVADGPAFDVPFHLVAQRIERDLESLVRAPRQTQLALIRLSGYAAPSQGAWWVRPLLGSPDPTVRGSARTRVRHLEPPDRYLTRGTRTGPESLSSGLVRLTRHRRGSEARLHHGVPDWATVGDLREGLGLAPKQLAYLLVASDRQHGDTPPPYSVTTIEKRRGGERTLHVPCAHLRGVQRRILHRVLEPVAPHAAAHGFVKHRSVTTHAALHSGKHVVVAFDLVDFFPTIHFFRAVGLFASLGYDVASGRFGAYDTHRGVAETLARLCVYVRNPRDRSGFTPQGAPTSPAIANLVCRRLDSRLSGLAKRLGGTYSRYADDLTFSFDADPEGGLGRFRWWVDAIAHQEGFLVHRGKFRVMRPSQRQVVCGVVVNERPRVGRRERRRFRAILHNCRAHGVASQARDNPRFTDWLVGFAAWVNAVDPDEGAALLREVREVLAAEGGEP